MPEPTDKPRLMTKPEAAAYCSITTAGIDLWIARGIVPGPLPGTRRYDRVALDRALDKLSGITSLPVPQETGLEKWQREDAERQRLAALEPESSLQTFRRERAERKRLEALQPGTRIDKILRERDERARAKNAAKAAQGGP